MVQDHLLEVVQVHLQEVGLDLPQEVDQALLLGVDLAHQQEADQEVLGVDQEVLEADQEVQGADQEVLLGVDQEVLQGVGLDHLQGAGLAVQQEAGPEAGHEVEAQLSIQEVTVGQTLVKRRRRRKRKDQDQIQIMMSMLQLVIYLEMPMTLAQMRRPRQGSLMLKMMKEEALIGRDRLL